MGSGEEDTHPFCALMPPADLLFSWHHFTRYALFTSIFLLKTPF